MGFRHVLYDEKHKKLALCLAVFDTRAQNGMDLSLVTTPSWFHSLADELPSSGKPTLYTNPD
jgi:hypothetical protein